MSPSSYRSSHQPPLTNTQTHMNARGDCTRLTSKLDICPCPEDVWRCLQNRTLVAAVSGITIKKAWVLKGRCGRGWWMDVISWVKVWDMVKTLSWTSYAERLRLMLRFGIWFNQCPQRALNTQPSDPETWDRIACSMPVGVCLNPIPNLNHSEWVTILNP
jgi:hypothetical protein